MMARNTAETVGMYAVLLRASSHVSPINWQSRLNILLARSLLSRPSSFVRFLPSLVNCKNNHNQRAIQTFPYSISQAKVQKKKSFSWDQNDTFSSFADLLKSTKAFSTASIRRIFAIMFQIPNSSSGSNISVIPGDIKRGGAAQRGDLVEPDSTEAQHGVARRIWLRDVNISALQRILQ